ncbi:MAG: peptidoglycan editing factor PgeF [Simkaniaceae bacterium]|nr:peptidoglycan editing factor PgeF [Simkaniaceae bacterium]
MAIQYKSKDSHHWIEYETLAKFPDISHGTFTKRATFEYMRTLAPCVRHPKLVHGRDVVVVEDRDQEIGEADGIVTSLEDVALFVTHADCQAALFFDPNKRVIGAVHSGWKGSAKNIYSETISVFKNRFDCDPADIHVVISPSLGPDSAEFINAEEELPRAFFSYEHKANYFDFWKISREQLEQEGVVQIQIAGIDTYQSTEDFYSFRKDKTEKRNASYIVLRSENGNK